MSGLIRHMTLVLKKLILKLCGMSLSLSNSSHKSCLSSHAFTHSILLHVKYRLEYIRQGSFFENGDEQANGKPVYYHLQPRNCVAHFRFPTTRYLFSIFGEVFLRSGLLVLIILLGWRFPRHFSPRARGRVRLCIFRHCLLNISTLRGSIKSGLSKLGRCH
jgi:hypothetical protein